MKFLIQLLVLLISNVAFGQFSTDSAAVKAMDEVVVTATRTPRLMGNVAIPVTVINSKTLYQTGSLRLNDILGEQTGINIVDGFGKGVQVQGLSSEYTLILVDGEPLIGRTGGVLDLSRISVRNIRKIEIVKGPSSSLYGSEAMGGVINIITDGAGQNKTDVGLRYGRFNTLDGTVNFSRRFNKTDVTASFNYNKSEGYSLKPNQAQKTVEPFWKMVQQISINHQLSDKWKLGSGFRRNVTYIDNTIQVSNQGVSILSKGFERNDEFNLTPYLQYKSGKIKTTLRGYITGFESVQLLNVKGSTGTYNDKFNQLFSRVENQTDWQIREQSSLTLGAGHVDESVASNRYDSISTKRKNSISYFFAQHEEQLTKQLTLIGGFRFDANRAYASVWSPKIALQFKASEKLSFNISYGRGFKAPDFRQLYLNFTNLAAGSYSVFGSEVAKPELDRLIALKQIDQVTPAANLISALSPEVSSGLNVGAKWKPNQGLQLSFNLFRNDIDNMIVTDVVAFKKNGGQIYSYFNLKSALTQGLEFDVDKRVSKSFSVKAGYQFLYTADKEVLAQIKKGETFRRDLNTGYSVRMKIADYGGLPLRSKHMANLKVNYENSNGFFATTRMIYRGRWGTFDQDGNGIINRSDEYAKGFLQVNASAGFSLKKNWKIMAGVDNILNYKDVLNMPGNPGRVGYIDLQFNF
ncbi:MAG: TonB-dependent receptor [Chitinophagaceae bacterium]|nr:TonB-dependent receptor [Chitinophagaceae bacterium]